jgi:hypothetical protein
MVLTLIRTGELPAITIGKTMVRVRPEDANAFEENFDTPGREPCDVYVIRCGDYVKIGKAGDVQKRLNSLRAANPYPLELLTVLTEGDGHVLERELHQRFAEYRHALEWFRFEGAVVSWVEQNTK